MDGFGDFLDHREDQSKEGKPKENNLTQVHKNYQPLSKHFE